MELRLELRLEGLTKKYQNVKAVDDVTCSLRNGVYGLLGVNGSGKTTLMRMLCTLLKPTDGSIRLEGQDVFEMDGEYRRLLGYLPQDFGYYPDFTVWDYLLYIASIKGLRPAVAKKRVNVLLEQVGLAEAVNKKMKRLSGGMKRRAGIAQALLNDPRILILDEPTVGLDPSERIRFRNLISELSEDRLVLLSTHIVSDIEYIANEIFLMKEGRIVQSGSVEALIAAMPWQVWSLQVPREEVSAYQRSFQIVNVKTVQGGARLRILSAECPEASAVVEAATLEDVFLYYFGERSGVNDDKI